MLWREEDQIDIFEILTEPAAGDLFQAEYANWQPRYERDDDRFTRVLGIIPKDVQDAREQNWAGRRNQNPELGDALDMWAGYVWAVAQLIPQEERSPDDWNGWGRACKMVKAARDAEEPIELLVCERYARHFGGLKVVEYL